MLSEKKIWNETKNHNPTLQVKWSVPNYIYIYILCNLPFSIEKEIPNKQNIIKDLFNASSGAAITVMLINKEVLTY